MRSRVLVLVLVVPRRGRLRGKLSQLQNETRRILQTQMQMLMRRRRRGQSLLRRNQNPDHRSMLRRSSRCKYRCLLCHLHLRQHLRQHTRLQSRLPLLLLLNPLQQMHRGWIELS